jgi:hypothetical protein
MVHTVTSSPRAPHTLTGGGGGGRTSEPPATRLAPPRVACASESHRNGPATNPSTFGLPVGQRHRCRPACVLPLSTAAQQHGGRRRRRGVQLDLFGGPAGGRRGAVGQVRQGGWSVSRRGAWSMFCVARAAETRCGACVRGTAIRVGLSCAGQARVPACDLPAELRVASTPPPPPPLLVQRQGGVPQRRHVRGRLQRGPSQARPRGVRVEQRGGRQPMGARGRVRGWVGNDGGGGGVTRRAPSRPAHSHTCVRAWLQRARPRRWCGTRATTLRASGRAWGR